MNAIKNISVSKPANKDKSERDLVVSLSFYSQVLTKVRGLTKLDSLGYLKRIR